MLAPKQLPPPANWQDFQELCRVLWKQVWQLSDEDIVAYGDNGDKQDGVDVYAIVNNQYYGIQCKSKDQLKGKQVTEAEIDAEIEKAKSFSPKLSKYILATSAPKNATIDNYALQKNAELSQQGLFNFRLLSWKDICNLLYEHKNALDYYQNRVQHNYDVQISINGTNEIALYPQFVRTRTIYRLKTKAANYHNPIEQARIDFQSLSVKLNQTLNCYEKWQSVPILIENTGDSVLRNIKFEIVLEDNKVKEVDKSRGCYSFSNCDGLGYHPSENTDLVQKESRTIALYLKLHDKQIDINADWEFFAEDFNKTGSFTIHVVPQYIDKEEIKEVEFEYELKPEEIIIEPLRE